MGQRLLSSPSSTMETKWNTAPKAKARQRHAEQMLAAADQGKDGVQQAERIQCRGHAQPDDAHFSHGAVRYSESKLPVYRGGAERTLHDQSPGA